MSLRSASDDPFDVPDLPSLIRDKLSAGATLQSLEVASGGVVKYQRWGQLSRGERLSEFPRPDSLVAMAKALGQTETMIVIAAARSLGMQVDRRGTAFGQRISAGADQIPRRVRSALLHLIDEMAADASTGEPAMDESEERQEAAYESPEPAGLPEPEQP